MAKKINDKTPKPKPKKKKKGKNLLNYYTIKFCRLSDCLGI